eukprot:gene20978-26432_t
MDARNDSTGAAGLLGGGIICHTPDYLPSLFTLPTMEVEFSPPSSPSTSKRRNAPYPRPSPNEVQAGAEGCSAAAVDTGSNLLVETAAHVNAAGVAVQHETSSITARSTS